MSNKLEHYHYAFFYLTKGKNADKSCKKIYNVYDDNAVKERV